jgi:adenine deaminase
MTGWLITVLRQPQLQINIIIFQKQKKTTMKKLIISLSIITMLITGSCTQTEKADLVIINGKVLTIDDKNPTAEAIAVKGETIIAVGSNAKISEMILKGSTKVIDAGGRLVIPGLY